MALITEYHTTARPNYSLVEVYDSDAYLDDADAANRSRTEVVAGNGYHLYLRSLQPDIRVKVVIRIWDSPQEPPGDSEGIATVTLESETGVLVINQITMGPAGEMTLPQPGVYAGHAWWKGRQAAADYYDEIIRQGATQPWSPGQLGQAWAQSPVTEQYTLDLWFLRACEPEDDEEL